MKETGERQKALEQRIRKCLYEQCVKDTMDIRETLCRDDQNNELSVNKSQVQTFSTYSARGIKS